MLFQTDEVLFVCVVWEGGEGGATLFTVDTIVAPTHLMNDRR